MFLTREHSLVNFLLKFVEPVLRCLLTAVESSCRRSLLLMISFLVTLLLVVRFVARGLVLTSECVSVRRGFCTVRCRFCRGCI